MNDKPVAWIDPKELDMDVSTSVTKTKQFDGDIPLYTHPSKELADAQNTIRQLAEKLECYERLVDSINMASNPMGVKSRVALRNPRVMTKEEIRKAVEAEREACAKVADEYANGPVRSYPEIIADLIRARSKHERTN